MTDDGRNVWDRIVWPPGWDVRFVDETGSTNTDLAAELAAGRARHGSVLAAGFQNAGKGRLDRRWDAPPGANLLVSLAFTDVPEHPSELTWRVGLALCDVLDEIAAGSSLPPVVGLKWPNDVLFDGRKLAGILAQRAGGAVIVGTGVNVGWAPEGAARTAEIDPEVTPADLLRHLLAAYDRLPDDVSATYRNRLLTLGAHVRAELPGGSTVTGRAVDVDGSGRLAVLDECAITHRLDVADVVHLRSGG